jgi:hypothetical protein
MEIKQVLKSQNLTPISKEVIARHLYKLNYIVPYPYPDNILLGMADVILHFKPDIKEHDVCIMVDDFLSGKIDYNREKGVVNFTKRLFEQNYKPFINPEENVW